VNRKEDFFIQVKNAGSKRAEEIIKKQEEKAQEVENNGSQKLDELLKNLEDYINLNLQTEIKIKLIKKKEY